MLLLLLLLIPAGSPAQNSFPSYDFPKEPAYVSTAEDYKCQFDSSCVKSLKDKFLNKKHLESVYQICESSYERIKNCCESLSACDSAYALNEGLSRVKSQLSGCDSGSAVLLAGLTQLQSEICRLGAVNCKIECENQLDDFLDRFRGCFNISRSIKIEDALKKAESNNSECYNLMRDIAGRYKSGSKEGLKRLRDKLSAKDIVECESIKPNALGLQRKAGGICQEITKERGLKQSEEEKKLAEEEKKAKELALRERERREEQKRLEEVLRTGSWKRGSKKRLSPSSKKESSSKAESSRLKSSSSKADIEKIKEREQKREQLIQSKRNELIKNLSLSAGSVSFEPIPKDFMELEASDKSGDFAFIGSELVSPEEEEKQGLFKAGLYKASLGVKKGVDKVKGVIPFMYSKREMREKMGQLCESHKNGIHLVDQVVYQSVKAPQIERQDEEDKNPFDDYELIRDKPAGMIVRVKKPKRVEKRGLQINELGFDAEKLMERFVFSISLKIEGRLYRDALCSRILDKRHIDYKPVSDAPEEIRMLLANSRCDFEWSDLRDKDVYKFISLPTELGEPLGGRRGKKEAELFVELRLKDSFDNQPVRACQASTKFTVNMIDPKSFKVLLTGMNGDHCLIKDEKGVYKKAYEKTTWESIKSYLDSQELTKDFYDMFPVSIRREGKHDKSPEVKAIKTTDEFMFLKGSCEKDYYLTLDALGLSNLALDYEGDLIFAVVKNEYFPYHNIGHRVAGRAVMRFPTRYIPIPFYEDHYFAYQIKKGVGFLKEGWEEQGLFLHEIGHTLGQKKEHYTGPDIPDYYCKQFTRKGQLPGTHHSSEPIGVLCPNYRIKGGVVRDYKFPAIRGRGRESWKLLNNQESIMHFISPMKTHTFYEKWIDRETYQKALGTIENNLIVPRDFLERIKTEQYPQEPKIIEIKNSLEQRGACRSSKRPIIRFSGLYRKKSKNRLTHFSIKARNIENKRDPFPLNQVSIRKKREDIDHILIQLKKYGVVEEEIVFPIRTYIETFYENNKAEKKELDIIPLFADFFPICDTPLKDDIYTLSIKEVYIENGVKKEQILKKPVPVRWELDV